MVMDKGIGMHQAEDLVETAANLIDFLKLGFGTSYVNQNVKEKIALYKKNGIHVYPGGTLFEAFLKSVNTLSACRKITWYYQRWDRRLPDLKSLSNNGLAK